MRSRVSAIGLDVGWRCVKAAQTAARAGSMRVIAAACFERAEPGEPVSAREMERIAAVLDRSGFVGRRCVIGVDRASLLMSELELPPSGTGAPREQIARLELARAHRREATGFELGLWDVPAPARSGGGAHALAVACPHEQAEAVLDVAESAGLIVTALDHPGCALARLVTVGDGRERVRAILDLGERAGVLTLVRAGVVLFEREIESCSIGGLLGRIAEQTGLDCAAARVLLDGDTWQSVEGARRGKPLLDRAARCVNDYAQAAGRELRLSLDYLEHRFPPGPNETGLVGHVDMVGGGAACDGVITRLGERSGLALKVLRPADLLGAAEGALRTASLPATCLAAGLALRATEVRP